MNLPEMTIGVTGCAGSGKSTVSSFFGKWGAEVIDADLVVHDQLDRPAMRRALTRIFGSGILRKGKIDRAALGRTVFSDDTAMKRLLEKIHPPVLRAIRKRHRALRKAGKTVVLDAPLLMETGLDALCDVTLLVTAPADLRAGRVRRRGLRPSDLKRRDRHMWPPARRKKKADYIIHNRTTRTALRRALERTLRDIGNQLKEQSCLEKPRMQRPTRTRKPPRKRSP